MQELKLFSLTTSLTVFVTYLTYVIAKYYTKNGKITIPESFSRTWIKLKGKEKILFTFFTWGISLPLLVFCYDKDTGVNWLLASGLILIAYVGAVPNINKKGFRAVHLIIAISGIVLALIGVL